MNIIKFLQNHRILHNTIYYLGTKRARKELYPKVINQISHSHKILDLGSGSCCLANILLKEGYDLSLLDVADISFVDDLHPQIYDGQTIPFPDKYFDIVLLLTVLHHTPNPELIIQEADRVGRKVIIIEDVFNNFWKMKLGHFLDSFTNMEFSDHPHSNKSDSQWKALFEKNSYKLINSSYTTLWKFGLSATYVIESI
mgnify:CR=1 FL=1